MAQTNNKGSAETTKKSTAYNSKAVQSIIEQRRAERKAARRQGALGYRIGAIVLWLLAIACEILAIMAILKDFTIKFTSNGNTNVTITIILFIVLDLILAIIAAQLWKRANHIDPPSEKNKFTFYLISELGVIMACICFIPLIIILLKNDKLDKKSKTIVTIVAIAALLITGFASADYNPISDEELTKAEEVFSDTVIHWTAFGHKYHLAEDCPYITNSTTRVNGMIAEAVESGRTSLCSYCAKHYLSDICAEHGETDLSGILSELNIDGDISEILNGIEQAAPEAEPVTP